MCSSIYNCAVFLFQIRTFSSYTIVQCSLTRGVAINLLSTTEHHMTCFTVDVCKSILVQILYIIMHVHVMYIVPIVTVIAAVSLLGRVLEVATMVME